MTRIKRLLFVLLTALFLLVWLVTLLGLLAPYWSIERLAVIQVIPPVLLPLGAILALYLWYFLRQHRAAWSTLALLGVLGVAWTASKDLRVGGSAQEGACGLKVVSYNVASFQFEADYAKRIATLLRSRQPDVVALQEFRNHDMGEGQLALAYLAEALDMPYYRFEHLPQHIHGAVIFSRHPIVGIDTLFMPEREINTGIIATIESPMGRIGVGNLHLSSYRMSSLIENRDRSERLGLAKDVYYKSLEVLPRQQAKVTRVLEVSQRYKYPLVLTGDFNAVPHSRIVQQFANQYTDSFLAAGHWLGWTYPLLGPLGLRIDYQFASDALEPTQHTILEASHSDHYPIEVCYRLQP